MCEHLRWCVLECDGETVPVLVLNVCVLPIWAIWVMLGRECEA